MQGNSIYFHINIELLCIYICVCVCVRDELDERYS